MIEYNGIQLRLIDGYELTKSSQNVTFSNIKADFTGLNSSSLPEKYEECRIIIDNKVKFFGYVNGYTFKEMRETDKYTEIEIELISPMTMATIRTTIATGTYQIVDLINLVFQPLIDEGFDIKELNITNRTTTVNYLCETIEYIMSDLSNKYNIWWYIDENKHIYIKDVVSLLAENPRYTYDNENKINGLKYIRPTIMEQDYANVINFTNVRLYVDTKWNYTYPEDNENPLINGQITSIKKNDELLFNHSIDITPKNVVKYFVATGGTVGEYEVNALQVVGEYSDGETFLFHVSVIPNTQELVLDNNVGFDGDEDSTKEVLLIRDNFFSNLIVGFKYNGNKTISSMKYINGIALMWNINKFYNDKEIKAKKGIISETGIVEKTINMNEQWKTLPELIDIATSYANKSGLSLDGQLEMEIDKETFNVGDIVYINKMLFNSNYIVTSVRETFNNNKTNYIVTCRNTNVVENYLDLFREPNEPDKDEKVSQITITHYTEEGIKEVHEVVR